MAEQLDLSVDLGRGLRLRSPVMVASGTFGYGFDAPLVDRTALGAIVTKGTTPRAREGNPPTRISETASGMLNANGLQFGLDPRPAARLTSAVRAVTRLPLLVKLTPNVTDIVAIGRAVEEAGADAVSAINTYVGMAIDVRRRRPVLSRGSGGLSGPAIKPLALHAVWQLSAALSIPVVGIGGIMTAADALEFLLAGAAAVQLGTVNYVRPQAAREVRDGIASYLDEHHLDDLGALPIRPARVEAHV